MAKKHKCEAGAPGWIVTFADLMSLLLTFFVLLLSFADTNVKKFRDVSGSIKEAFGVQTVAYFNRKPSSTDHFEDSFGTAGQEWETLNSDPSMMGIEFESFCALEKQHIQRERHSLTFVEQELKRDLASVNMQDDIDINLDKNVLKLKLKFSEHFKSSKSDWSESGLRKFATVISMIDRQSIDSKVQLQTFSPMRLTSEDVTAWSLKSQRAINLLGVLRQTNLARIKHIEHKDQPVKEYNESIDSFELQIRMQTPTY